MGREPLTQQVAEALAKIRHREDCYSELGGGSCFCDREARIAAAVARAIEACGDYTRHSYGQGLIDAALQALGEAPRP